MPRTEPPDRDHNDITAKCGGSEVPREQEIRDEGLDDDSRGDEVTDVHDDEVAAAPRGECEADELSSPR
jgi:hypothetical protein